MRLWHVSSVASLLIVGLAAPASGQTKADYKADEARRKAHNDKVEQDAKDRKARERNRDRNRNRYRSGSSQGRSSAGSRSGSTSGSSGGYRGRSRSVVCADRSRFEPSVSGRCRFRIIRNRRTKKRRFASCPIDSFPNYTRGVCVVNRGAAASRLLKRKRRPSEAEKRRRAREYRRLRAQSAKPKPPSTANKPPRRPPAKTDSPAVTNSKLENAARNTDDPKVLAWICEQGIGIGCARLLNSRGPYGRIARQQTGTQRQCSVAVSSLAPACRSGSGKDAETDCTALTQMHFLGACNGATRDMANARRAARLGCGRGFESSCGRYALLLDQTGGTANLKKSVELFKGLCRTAKQPHNRRIYCGEEKRVRKRLAGQP